MSDLNPVDIQEQAKPLPSKKSPVKAIPKKTIPPDGKRPVGRPRKSTSLETQEVAGVVTSPVTQDNIFELISTSTGIFKKIIQLYKTYVAGEFQMYMLSDGLVIRGDNHTKDTKIGIFVDGKAMQSYYCESPIELVSNLADFDKSFGTIGKTHNKIVISVARARPKVVNISLFESAHSVITDFEIPVANMGFCTATPNKYLDMCLSDACVQPVLKFSLESKLFKTEITQIQKVSQIMRITREKDKFLQMESEQGRVPVRHRFPRDVDILLEQNYPENVDIFTVSFGSANVKPFASTSLGDRVVITAYDGPLICFSSKTELRANVYGFTMEILINVQGYAETH